MVTQSAILRPRPLALDYATIASNGDSRISVLPTSALNKNLCNFLYLGATKHRKGG